MRAAVRRAARVLALAGALAAVDAGAHGGLSMDEDRCKLVVGRFVMHFTGYQPDAVDGPREFCEDIPATGRTVVVLDYLHDELRDLPTEVKVVRDTGGDADGETILHLPPKLYPTGSLSFEIDFREPGRFVGLVTVGGHVPMVSRFPFAVGASSMAWWHGAVAVAVVAAAGVFLYRFAVRRRAAQARP